MRKPLVAGNWKMNGTRVKNAQLLAILKNSSVDLQTELAIFPPYIYLEQIQQALSGSSISWGAQNVYQQEEGAYTGEISPKMLKEFGCTYVIVGHSERRQLMGETSAEVAAKF